MAKAREETLSVRREGNKKEFVRICGYEMGEGEVDDKSIYCDMMRSIDVNAACPFTTSGKCYSQSS